MRPRGKKKKSVFGNKLASKEAALATWWGQQPGSRIKRGGVAPRGRQQVQSACRENATVRERETKLTALVLVFPPSPNKEMGGQVDVRSRRMEGHMQTGTCKQAQSLQVCVCGRGCGHVERQRLDCSPGPSNAPTRASRDTPQTIPDLQMLGDRAFPPTPSPPGPLNSHRMYFHLLPHTRATSRGAGVTDGTSRIIRFSAL